ncbi:hypothetical protein [Microbacterium sp. PF5]|uniref:hypothetical protein n=1 Tax=Microbacterium sp. PF5 TaxID=2305435 RepID=UPI00109BB71F|nr:hypothetical protein [Microbacterium sp. PF5]
MQSAWLTLEEAGTIAPGLTSARLSTLLRSPARLGPPVWTLTDRQRLFDELLFRRWLEATVATDWVLGPAAGYRSPPSPDRRYVYADADLATLRRRTYVSESSLSILVPELPLWRVRDLRFRGAGPRFLKPTPRTVVYITEEVSDWAEGVSDFSDRVPVSLDGSREPYTPPPRLSPLP